MDIHDCIGKTSFYPQLLIGVGVLISGIFVKLKEDLTVAQMCAVLVGRRKISSKKLQRALLVLTLLLLLVLWLYLIDRCIP
ncbi:hypothetical protein [Tritonibacter mobilis]|uniref:hypothetical protein n=1 Tax=Tritonibacter mobilis TaxID=379347 RepID=UPI000806C288|nr:hypothetical protein [Tritonibacter mobilis]